MDVPFFPRLGIGVTLWTGVYAGKREETYLRWCDEGGAPLLIGDELAVLNADRADGERARADTFRAMLLKHGIDPGD